MKEIIYSYLYPITTPSENYFLGIFCNEGNKVFPCRTKECMGYKIQTLFESDHYRHGNNENNKQQLTLLAELREESSKPKEILIRSKV